MRPDLVLYILLKAAQAVGKNCQNILNILNTGELVAQRYSEEVTGKVQKYARMGARQFVPYSYGELTIENVKEACIRHFTRQFQVGTNVAYGVLAGDQGSSCVSMSQILDLCVIHFRFIKARDHESLKSESFQSRTRHSAPDSSTPSAYEITSSKGNGHSVKYLLPKVKVLSNHAKAPYSEGSPSNT